MKVVNIDNQYVIYDDSLKVHGGLTPQTYVVRCGQQGFYLEKYADIEIPESKIYGTHNKKVDKVLRSFREFSRNLGVILSGDKGIGKSLFAKLLAAEAIERSLPVIVVDRYIPGIASYIERIDQEVLVMFDEFDKTFGGITPKDGTADPQTEMLTLFDGMSQGKKLFVITCNDLNSLNTYLVNRPGRFHYHFRFEYPTAEEIEEYLKDKLNENYYSEIDKVIVFSKKVDLNYDCLRSIAFELNSGESFEEVIKYLNIVNLKNERYITTLKFTDGTIMTGDVSVDLFDKKEKVIDWVGDGEDPGCYVTFNVIDCVFDLRSGSTIVPGNKLKITPDEYATEEYKKVLKSLTPEKLILDRMVGKSLHYAL